LPWFLLLATSCTLWWNSYCSLFVKINTWYGLWSWMDLCMLVCVQCVPCPWCGQHWCSTHCVSQTLVLVTPPTNRLYYKMYLVPSEQDIKIEILVILIINIIRCNNIIIFLLLFAKQHNLPKCVSLLLLLVIIFSILVQLIDYFIVECVTRVPCLCKHALWHTTGVFYVQNLWSNHIHSFTYTFIMLNSIIHKIKNRQYLNIVLIYH